jgi:hypothetical protein
MTRALLVVAILLAMLVVPIYLWGDKGVQRAETEQRERAASPAAAAPTPAAQVGGGRLDGQGHTFGLAPDERVGADLALLVCQGEPAGGEGGTASVCNALHGDTSCRTVLPVLCLRSAAQAMPTGLEAALGPAWTGGELAATDEVMGALLESEAAASARCAQAFGPGWRMASTRDASGGTRQLAGLRGSGLLPRPGQRYWVATPGTGANCWVP